MPSPSPGVRYRRSYLETEARRALHSPAVRALALFLWLVSAAISSYLLMQAISYLEWLRDYSMKVVLVSFAAAIQNRVLYGFVLPFTAGVIWLASLIVMTKYYEAYGLHARWWKSWTAITPFSQLSPGSGASVLISRFLFVLGVQGCVGVVVIAAQWLLWGPPINGYESLLFLGSAYVVVGASAFTVLSRVRERIVKDLVIREAAFDRGVTVGRTPLIK